MLINLVCSVLASGSLASGIEDASRVETYREVEGQALKVHIFQPEPDKKTGAAMLMVHGGGWTVGSPAWVASTAELMAANGIVGIPVQYRLSRGEITPLDAFHDVCAALSWARENAQDLGIDRDRIGFYGVSAGGHLSALTATAGCPDSTVGPAAFVLYSPALNMREDGWFIKKLQGEAEPEAMSPFHNVGPQTPPTLIISGREDTLTPHKWAEDFCESVVAQDQICRVEGFDDVGHLLTIHLDTQESGFESKPEDRARAGAAILDFLADRGFTGTNAE